MEPKISQIWQSPPPELSLSEGAIHLWLASLEVTLPKVRMEDLSAAEQGKAASLKNEGVRTQFVVSRWLTRQLLGRYLQAEPASIEFILSERGKPSLPGIEFNRSHAGGWFVLAISKNVPVGVDLEKMTPRPQMEAIVERWFEPSERERFSALPEIARSDFFHRHWTQKEAVLKAWGVGLVQLTDYSQYQEQSWKHSFEPISGFTGCVAATKSGADFSLKYYRA